MNYGTITFDPIWRESSLLRVPNDRLFPSLLNRLGEVVLGFCVCVCVFYDIECEILI